MNGFQLLQKPLYGTANKIILRMDHFTFKVCINSQYYFTFQKKKILPLNSAFLFPSPQIIWHMIYTAQLRPTYMKTSSNVKV